MTLHKAIFYYYCYVPGLVMCVMYPVGVGRVRSGGGGGGGGNIPRYT